MRLANYNVAIMMTDPDNPETKATFSLERHPREKLLRMELLGLLVESFEAQNDSEEQAT